MTTYSITIKLIDEETLNLKNVISYKSSTESNTVIVEFATGYRAIFNLCQVKYIVRDFDLNAE